MSGNGPPIGSNTWSPVGENVWEGFGGVALEEMYLWEDSEASKASCRRQCALCFRSVGQDEFAAAVPMPRLPTAVHPGLMVTSSYPYGTISPK